MKLNNTTNFQLILYVFRRTCNHGRLRDCYRSSTSGRHTSVTTEGMPASTTRYGKTHRRGNATNLIRFCVPCLPPEPLPRLGALAKGEVKGTRCLPQLRAPFLCRKNSHADGPSVWNTSHRVHVSTGMLNPKTVFKDPEPPFSGSKATNG